MGMEKEGGKWCRFSLVHSHEGRTIAMYRSTVLKLVYAIFTSCHSTPYAMRISTPASKRADHPLSQRADKSVWWNGYYRMGPDVEEQNRVTKVT